MNWREKLAALYKEGRALADKSEKDGLSEAEEARFSALKGEIEEARTKWEAEEARSTAAQSFRDGDREFNQPSGRRVSGMVPGGAEGRAQDNAIAAVRGIDAPMSASDTFLTSDAYKEWRAKYSSPNTAGTSNPVEIGSFRPGMQRVELDERGNLIGPQESRALVYSGGGMFPTGLVPAQRVPGIFTSDRPELTVRDAFLNGQATSDTIEFFRELAHTNAAAFVAEATATSPTTLGQSGVKPEGNFTLERATAVAGTIAEWMAVTNKALRDAPMMRTLIDGYLMDDIKYVEDDAILNGDGSSPNIRGLLNTTGIQELDATYFSANPVADAGTANELFNRLLAARQAIRYTGRARANFAFVHPADMEQILTSTDANRQYFGAGPFSPGGSVPSLWGLRLIETEAIDEGFSVVGDGRKAAVWDRMAATIVVGLINDQLIRNMQTILAEEELIFTVYRPPAFAVVTLP